MPVISLYSSKGGAGKTTTAMVVASTLHKLGFNIQVIDADPNQPIMSWVRKRAGAKAPFSIISCLDEGRIGKTIKEASMQFDFVIVDVEGSKNIMAAHAVSRADLVLIPAQRSTMDLEQAANAINFIRSQQEILDRTIKFCLTITNTPSAIVSKNERAMRETLRKGSFAVSGKELRNKEAYKEIFDYSKTLYEILESGSLDLKATIRFEKAIEEGEVFTAEILNIMNQQEEGEIQYAA